MRPSSRKSWPAQAGLVQSKSQGLQKNFVALDFCLTALYNSVIGDIYLAYSCKIIEDSISPAGARLTTFEVCFPRIILAEMNTHRAFSRNSASSRAIPIAKMITSVKRDPFVPFYWGKNQSGMQASAELTGWRRKLAIFAWLRGRDVAVLLTKVLAFAGCHKQTANRVLEPWLYHTVIVTSTEWDNFFKQRCDPAAQPEIRLIADMMKIALSKNQPVRREFHLPYITPDEVGLFYKPQHFKLSVARCARVSYLNHDGTNDIKKDLGLYKKLIVNGHMSPAEHQATALESAQEHSGNFTGWKQYRKVLEEEVC